MDAPQSNPLQRFTSSARLSAEHTAALRSMLSGGRKKETTPVQTHGIRYRTLDEDAPFAFFFALFHLRGTVHERIYPQLILSIIVSVFAYVYNVDVGTNGGFLSNVAHASFGTSLCRR